MKTNRWKLAKLVFPIALLVATVIATQAQSASAVRVMGFMVGILEVGMGKQESGSHDTRSGTDAAQFGHSGWTRTEGTRERHRRWRRGL